MNKMKTLTLQGIPFEITDEAARNDVADVQSTVENLLKNGADWNAKEGEMGYVKNRTHYEESTLVNEPLNITWDGNTDGLVQIPEMPFFKISDLVLTDEQIKSITLTMSDGSSLSLADGWDEAVDMGMVTEDVVNAPVAVFARKNSSAMEGTSTVIPEAGIYLLKPSDEIYVTSLTTTEPVEHTKTVVKKLDKKFLPEDIGGRNLLFIVDHDANTFNCNVSNERALELIEQGVSPTCKFISEGSIFFIPNNEMWYSTNDEHGDLRYSFDYSSGAPGVRIYVYFDARIEIECYSVGK